jgi:hypothetical protein
MEALENKLGTRAYQPNIERLTVATTGLEIARERPKRRNSNTCPMAAGRDMAYPTPARVLLEQKENNVKWILLSGRASLSGRIGLYPSLRDIGSIGHGPTGRCREGLKLEGDSNPMFIGTA